MKMNPIEFIKLLSTVANRYCESKSNYDQLRAIKLNLDMWPECEAKKVMQSFDEMVAAKGFDYATYMNADKFNNYETLQSDLVHNLTEDYKHIELVIETNCKELFIKSVARQLLSKPERFAELYTQLAKVESMTGVKDEFKVSEHIDQVIEKNEASIESGKSQIIIPDFQILSEQIGGFNGSRVSGISAKSGFGKTKLAVNLADSARKVMPVYYFNMEMSAEDFCSQFIQKNASLTYKQWKQGDYKNSITSIIDFKASFSKTHDIVFTGGKSLNLSQVCAKIALNMKRGGLVIVDYDQKLMFDENLGEEWQAMVRAMERLEEIAKSTDCHIIVLFQADEDGFAKSSKRAIQPLSSFTTFTRDEERFFLKNIKNRFGVTGFEIEMEYKPETTQIKEKSLVDFILRQKEVNKGVMRKKSDK